MTISRRDFLQMAMLGTGGGAVLSFMSGVAAQTPAESQLASAITEAIGNRAIGIDLRRVDDEGEEQFRVQVNGDILYPVASCFKTFTILYYCWNMPYLKWSSPDEDSNLYRIAVFSANRATTTLLYEVADRIETPNRNAIEKFNDFLIYTMGLRNGIYRWSPGSADGDSNVSLATPAPVATDGRFAPSLVPPDERYVEVRGERYLMDNLFAPADLANGYARLLASDPFPDVPRAETAIEVVLDLHSIPAESYESPFERAFERPYTGKDGVLPTADSPVGRVINDAGIVEFDSGRYVIAFMCMDGEFTALEVLGDIRTAIEDYESTIA